MRKKKTIPLSQCSSCTSGPSELRVTTTTVVPVMESASLVFSSGRPGKGSMVASFFMLTLALVTLTVAALVLFTAFKGWNSLAVRRRLRALDPLVAMGEPRVNGSWRSKKHSSTPADRTHRRIPIMPSENSTMVHGNFISSFNSTMASNQPSSLELTANNTSNSLPSDLGPPARPQRYLTMMPTTQQNASNSSTGATSLKLPTKTRPEILATKNDTLEEAHHNSSHSDKPSRRQENLQHLLLASSPPEGNLDISHPTFHGAVRVRDPPRLSDGSEWALRMLSAFPDADLKGVSEFFLGANGSSQRHHNHSGLGQRPIFVPENPAHTHKIYAVDTSTRVESKASAAPSELPTLTTIKLFSSENPPRQTLTVKANSTGKITGSGKPTENRENGDVFNIRSRASWPTEPFQRPHRHDISGDLSQNAAENKTEAAAINHHKSHVGGSAAGVPANAERRARNHESHVPRLLKLSTPAIATVLTDSAPAPDSFTKTIDSPPTESTLPATAKTLQPRSDLVTTVTEETTSSDGDEREPFTEESETEGEPGIHPTETSLHNYYRTRSRVNRRASNKPNVHKEVTHKSHVRKINSKEKSRARESNRPPAGMPKTNQNKSATTAGLPKVPARPLCTLSRPTEKHPSVSSVSSVARSVATSSSDEDFTAFTSWDTDLQADTDTRIKGRVPPLYNWAG